MPTRVRRETKPLCAICAVEPSINDGYAHVFQWPRCGNGLTAALADGREVLRLADGVLAGSWQEFGTTKKSADFKPHEVSKPAALCGSAAHCARVPGAVGAAMSSPGWAGHPVAGSLAESVPAHESGSRHTIERRFQAVNRERLLRLMAALSPRQRIFIELLPLLFHTNHAGLPGFVSLDTPFGVAGYLPPKSTISAAQTIAKGIDYKRRLPREYGIEAIYLMGSAGTIAYTDKSDFDVWLCHQPRMDSAALGRLQTKAESISRWASELSLEVHFFVLTAEDVRLGRHTSLSSESSGSAQRHLLVDEFYRTALLVAGRKPLWWLVPPDHEDDYGESAAQLLEQRLINPGEVIDFGGLSHIPANEFFGATLWQLYKAVSSPYKSLLKILLLEAYASEFPHTDLLSQRYKRMIYEGDTQLDRLDPYVLMLEKIENYLERIRDYERLEFVRRGFYVKTGVHLTRTRGLRADDQRRQQLLQLTRRWGWDRSHLHTLDLRGSWKVDRILDERRLLVNGLTRSYRFLSAFARDQEEVAAITQEDMNVLGRRLFAAYEHKSGKIERLTQGITQDLSEPNLSLRQLQSGDQESWLLYRGAPSPDRSWSTEQPLKRSRTLIELLLWCHVNGVATRTTQIAVLPVADGLVSLREVSEVLESLRRQYPVESLDEPSLMELSAPARPTRSGIFINLGVDPFAAYTRHGMFLTTDRHDPLNYSSREENLALSFDYLYVTSWREIFAFRFEGFGGLMECLCQYLRACRPKAVPLDTVCLSASRGDPIAQRVGELFQDATACFAAAADPTATRFVTRIGGCHYVIHGGKDGKCYERIGSDSDLLRHLGQPGTRFWSVVFWRHTLPDSPLSAIYAANRPGAVQLFFQALRGTATIYVLDEHGALHHDTVPFHDEETLLSQYARFFEAVRYRENAAASVLQDGIESWRVEFFRVTRTSRGALIVQSVETGPDSGSPGYVELKVITERAGDKTEFTLFCNGVEFSTVAHGDGVFDAVARHIVGLRRHKGRYPIYITEIDLSGIVGAEERTASPRTLHYLSYKKRIEARLNQALAGL